MTTTKWVVVAVAGLVSAEARAQDVCDGLDGVPQGLCQAACETDICDDRDSPACVAIARNYDRQRDADDPAELPCLAPPPAAECPCYTDADLQALFDLYGDPSTCYDPTSPASWNPEFYAVNWTEVTGLQSQASASPSSCYYLVQRPDGSIADSRHRWDLTAEEGAGCRQVLATVIEANGTCL